MRQRFIIISIITICCILFVGCSNRVSKEVGVQDKIKVIATAYPVYGFTKMISGDKIELSTLIPNGVEPHEWEPTAKDLVQIQSVNLFLFHGAGFEPWLGKVTAAEILSKIRIVQVSKDIPLLAGDNGHGKHEHLATGENDPHLDPHVWLDPVLAVAEVENITEALISADNANEEYYRKNSDNVKKALVELDLEYKNALDKVFRRDFVTSHAAFGYLAKRYQLHQVPVMGLTPDAEPTPEKMRQVVQFCRDNKVKVVFFETLVSPRLSETIARETGAKTMILSPVEGLSEQEIAEGLDYFSIMRRNLKNLQIALEQ